MFFFIINEKYKSEILHSYRDKDVSKIDQSCYRELLFLQDLLKMRNKKRKELFL